MSYSINLKTFYTHVVWCCIKHKSYSKLMSIHHLNSRYAQQASQRKNDLDCYKLENSKAW